MNTIRSLYGMRQQVGCVGLEIETEAAVPYEVPRIQGWKHKGDGSLRDYGIEYISNGPVQKKNIPDALKTWKGGLGDIHARLNPHSISTSVHVHVNIQELTPLELLNFYLTSVAVENLMSRYAGPDREGNLFCLRTSDAETNYNSIRRAVTEAKDTNHIAGAFGNVGENRYANINPVAVRNFGSLEFRVMRGTTDINEIQIWSETLLAIRDYTQQFKNPKEILLKIKEKGVESFVKEALGTHGKVFMTPGYEKLVLPNLGYLAQVATSRKDWDLKDPEKLVRRQAMVRPAPAGFDDNGRVVVQWDEQFEVMDM